MMRLILYKKLIYNILLVKQKRALNLCILLENIRKVVYYNNINKNYVFE